MTEPLEIFCVCAPGLEQPLLAEMNELGFHDLVADVGGVKFSGGWSEVWRANLELRGAARVLVRLGHFMAFHLAQLDKRARKFQWQETFRPNVPVRVQVSTRASKIYHAKAAAERIERALTEVHGIPIASDAALVIKVRIHDNHVVISVDSSGEALHMRGHKEAVGKAPMRENLAAMFLRLARFDGREPVFDPMCGSGTFPIEAAEIAAGMQPGRSRHFAFEQLASFDASAFAKLRRPGSTTDAPVMLGCDRDQGAVRNAQANAERAGLGNEVQFSCQALSTARAPDGPPGLVIVNPPYGTRIGNKKPLFALYGSFGEVMRSHFGGWRVALVTSEPALAKATGLPWLPLGPPVAHGGLKVWLWQTDSIRSD